MSKQPRDPEEPERIAVGRRTPLFGWARGYGAGTLRMDVVAGVTLAAYLLPAAIGDASLARLPPEAGIYACLFSGLVFWVFSSSRRTAITVTSAISLLMGTTLGAMAEGDASRFGALAACTALMVAGLALLAWLIRAGSLVNFVSETVLLGFKVGVALTLMSTQLPKLFGLGAGHGGFWECVEHFLGHLNEANFAAIAVGGTALAVLILGKVYLPNKPVSLVVVIAGIVAAGALGLGEHGVKMLGEVPRGLPAPGLPSIQRSDLNELLPLALACFVLGAVETAAIGRMWASAHGDRFDPNREFLALAGANLAAGLGRGFPVSGGMSQSLVNAGAGARTPLSGLVAALSILVVAVFFSGALRTLPQPVLAAIVLMAVPGLIKVEEIRSLWRRDRQELLIAAAALGGVLASGLLRGALIGAVLSLLLLIRRASRPNVAFLGRIPGTRRYSDVARHADNEPVPGVLIVRPESSILYFNAEFIHDAVIDAIDDAEEAPRAVVVDLSAAALMDIHGAAMLKKLAAELRDRDIRLDIVEARSRVRDRLRVEGVDDAIGGVDRFRSVADAVEAAMAGADSGPAGSAAPASARR
ncbi:MAG TPA: SulP family inorganic anion transporter [Phycisphaerales bacterium]|nr:SulP family inorganic anion transporter [Phycisphaerales bacterium]HMP37792.1 SulP family inorganic anion transporter [Phycisphaerales bacterium]